MKKIKNLICKISPVIIMPAFILSGCSGRQTADLITGESDEVIMSDDIISDIPEEDADDFNSESAEPGINFIYVYVCGAVAEADVYRLSEGSRAEDALEAAGGFADNADRIYVNLAESLYDGERLYFPYEDDDMATDFMEEAESTFSDDTSQKENETVFPININTADITGLSSIPGIGSAKAQAIIEYRENNGRFEYPRDITNVSGIGEATFEKIAEYICTY